MSVTGFTLVLVALVPSSAAQVAAPWKEARLAEVPPGFTVGDELFYRSNRGAFCKRSSLGWSADGRQVAYIARREDEWHPVLGEQVGDAYDDVSAPVLAGGHVFFSVCRARSEHTAWYWLWIDGRTLEREDWMGDLGVSADGRQVAYWSQPGAKLGLDNATARKCRLVVGSGNESGTWSFRRGEEWPDSSCAPPVLAAGRVLTCAVERKGWVVLEAGSRKEKEVSEPHPSIDAFSISADGAALAFVRSDQLGSSRGPIPAADENAELWFRGKRVGSRLTGITLPTVDPRGEHVACAVAIEGQRTVAVDGERLEGRFEYVQELAFDPTGKRLAFIANRGGHPSSSVPGAFEGGTSCVIVRTLDGTTPPEEYPSFLEARDLTWAAGGEHFAFAARDGSGWSIRCGERSSDPHDDVGSPRFASDGRSLGFGSRDGRELWWRVLELE